MKPTLFIVHAYSQMVLVAAMTSRLQTSSLLVAVGDDEKQEEDITHPTSPNIASINIINVSATTPICSSGSLGGPDRHRQTADQCPGLSQAIG